MAFSDTFSNRRASNHRPLICAHRGASLIAPENTLLAFRLAIEAGAEMIETDAHLARDGELVLVHDADLRRTTNCGGSVGDLRLDELAACDAGYWFTPEGERRHPFRGLGLAIPRLADALELVDALDPAVIVNVELKNQPDELDFDPTSRIADRLVELLRRQGALDSVLVSSFNTDTLDRVKALEPAIRTACLCGPGADIHARVAWARARGHNAIHPHHSALGHGETARRLVDVIHQAGLAVNVWTVNERERSWELAEAGVDGIISDDPERLRRALERRAVPA